jgi:hypothetical protein
MTPPGDGGRRSLVDTWLTATFGFKDRYSDQEIEAVCKEGGPVAQQAAAWRTHRALPGRYSTKQEGFEDTQRGYYEHEAARIDAASEQRLAEGPDFTRYHRDSDFRDAPEMRLDRHEGQTRRGLPRSSPDRPPLPRGPKRKQDAAYGRDAERGGRSPHRACVYGINSYYHTRMRVDVYERMN